MSGFCIEWDDIAVQQMLKQAIDAGKDFTKVMQNFSGYMMMETEGRFVREEAPDGSGWQRLSDVTLKLREEADGDGKKLQISGGLKNSIQDSYDSTSASLTSIASSGMKYAAIHNFGGQAGWNHLVTIPQREFLGFNDEDIEHFRESVAGWLVTGKVE